MSNIHVLFILFCSVLLGGCSRGGRGPEVTVLEKESPAMIQIENFEVKDKTLTIDYRVTNSFADDIHVCEAGCLFNCLEEAGTRIDGETLWITRRSKSEMKTDSIILANPPGMAKYLRLKPEEYHSWRIVLDLPIMKFPSGIFSLTEERAKKRKHIVLHRVVFAIGYFPPKYNRFFVEASVWGKKDLGITDDDTSVVSPVFGLRIDPYVVNEIHEGKSRQVLYIGANSPSENLEESATVVITDVDIPCSVVDEE